MESFRKNAASHNWLFDSKWQYGKTNLFPKRNIGYFSCYNPTMDFHSIFDCSCPCHDIFRRDTKFYNLDVANITHISHDASNGGGSNICANKCYFKGCHPSISVHYSCRILPVSCDVDIRNDARKGTRALGGFDYAQPDGDSPYLCTTWT